MSRRPQAVNFHLNGSSSSGLPKKLDTMPQGPPQATVRFSKYSKVNLIPKKRGAISEKWYSPKDKHYFRCAVSEDVRRISREVEEAKLSRDHLHLRVGIEVFLKEGLPEQMTETKSSHVQAVLAEYRHQKRQGICDIEKLSRVSQETRWTSERAHILASGYWLQHTFENGNAR